MRSKRVVRFFDPHPGLMGCPQQLPEPLRKLAADLDGKTQILTEALKQIRTTLRLVLCTGETGKAKVAKMEDGGFISVRIKRVSGAEDGWRLICFKP